MTAYAYLRRSSVSAESPGDASREAQEDAVRALAVRHGDTPVLLVDWGVSGRKGRDKRPGYSALLDAIDSGQCTAVYSYSLSRLGRSLPELARLIEDCGQRHIPVRLAVDALDTSTASGRLLANVLGSVAAFEADVAGERVRASQAARVARGQRLGPDYFPGYQLVLDAYDEAGSLSGAARLLNDRGVKPKASARGWWPSTIDTIVKRHRPQMPSPGRGSRAAGRFALSRLLVCPTCGARLTGSIDTGYGERTVRYACRMSGARPHVKASVLERVVMPWVQAEAARFRVPRETVALGEKNSERRAVLDEQRSRAIESYIDGLITRPERATHLAAIDDELATMDAMERIETVPREVDWSSDVGAINEHLRALWGSIRFDETMHPVEADWLVPEWRTA